LFFVDYRSPIRLPCLAVLSFQRVERDGDDLLTRDHPIDSQERAKRTGDLFRSVLPQDIFQMLFVLGLVCFWIAPQLEWGHPFKDVPLTTLAAIQLFAPHAFSFAAAAGCFLFFRSRGKPTLNLLWWVCVPALVGLVAICTRFIQIALAVRGSIDSASMCRIVSFSVFTAKGFHWALGGFVLVAIFTWRVWRGDSSLPLALEKSSVLSPDSAPAWHHLHIVMWILLSGVWKLFFWLIGIVIFFGLMQSPRFLRQDWIFYVALNFLSLLSFIGLAVWTNGRETLTALWHSIRLAAPESFLLALALPFGTVLLGSFVYYLLDFLRWTVESSPTNTVPHFVSFFSLPSPRRIAGLLPGVFVEEVIFRAVLLRQFIIRYGVLRGLVLLSTLFAAWHYGSDFSPLMNDREVASHLCLRSLQLVTTGLMFGWLTMRTGSILPAVLAHALFNSFSGYSMSGSSVSLWTPLQASYISLSIGLLAYLLLRYWPIQGRLGADGPP
jgi:membrane protease YdiL (CAAX protease family)